MYFGIVCNPGVTDSVFLYPLHSSHECSGYEMGDACVTGDGTLENSEDKDDKAKNVAFHQGLHCLLI